MTFSSLHIPVYVYMKNDCLYQNHGAVLALLFAFKHEAHLNCLFIFTCCVAKSDMFMKPWVCVL